MTDVYRWAVVAPDGRITSILTPHKAGAALMADRWSQEFNEVYTVRKFRLVECEEGEGE